MQQTGVNIRNMQNYTLLQVFLLFLFQIHHLNSSYKYTLKNFYTIILSGRVSDCKNLTCNMHKNIVNAREIETPVGRL